MSIAFLVVSKLINILFDDSWINESFMIYVDDVYYDFMTKVNASTISIECIDYTWRTNLDPMKSINQFD